MSTDLHDRKIATALNFYGFTLTFSSPTPKDDLVHPAGCKHSILETSALEEPKGSFQLKKCNDPMNAPSPEVIPKITKKSGAVK